MAEGRSLTPISMADYEAIESAVMETERGRWFLREYAKRNRNADTDVLLEAITRLEQVILGDRLANDRDRLRATLREMARAIALTREEAGELRKLERMFAGTPDPEPLSDIVRISMAAASQGRRAAAEIREAATALQTHAHDQGLLRRIERSSAEVATAFDRTEAGTRTVERIVGTLRYLETRIQEMLSAGSSREAAGVSPEREAGLAETEGTSAGSENRDLPPAKPEVEGGYDARPEPDAVATASAGDNSPDIETRELVQQDRPEPRDPADTLGELGAAADIAACEKAAAGAPEETIAPEGIIAPDLAARASGPLPQHPPSAGAAQPLPSPPSSGDVAAGHTMESHIPPPRAEPAFRIRPNSSFRREAFAEIDRLSTREKLRLFT